MYYNMLLPLTQILFTSTQNYTQICSTQSLKTSSSAYDMYLYQLSSQQNYLMDHNNLIKSEDSFPGLLELLQEAREQFFKKLKYFITVNSQNSPQTIRFTRGGFAFLLISHQDQLDTLSPLIQETFNCSYSQFTKQATRYGLIIRTKMQGNKKMSLFLSKQKLDDSLKLQESPLDENEVWQSSQQDEFPKEQELQEVLKEKQEKSKSAFVKPKFLNKTHSEGYVGFCQAKREDASIQVKLEQQVHLSTSKYHNFNFKSEPQVKFEQTKFQEICPLSLADRLSLQKANYQKCSRLIDGTIFEILEAYKNKKVQERQEPLMEKIVQIYDLLSNAIENGTSMAKMISARESNSNDDRNDSE